ncbi:hypothetical protein B566_EDAN012779 [Ephemera danica]|nr:hypothetical protein B566_EDAN012779 [Ephemera danica]
MIKSRGKDRHLIHEELVQAMKWKLARGKFYPQLSYLIKVNTPKAVMSETRKAFRKLPNLEQAITALSNLKGEAPFMADECLMAIPDFEGIDYTTKEYLNFVQHIRTVVDRLNKEAKSTTAWNPHRVELALWTHYVVSENKPELLEAEPPKNGNSHHTAEENGVTGTKPEEAISDDSTQDTSSKDSPAPHTILSPEDSLLEPPTTEDSMDAGTAEDESSRECSNQAREMPLCPEAALPTSLEAIPSAAVASPQEEESSASQLPEDKKEIVAETEAAEVSTEKAVEPAAEPEPPVKRVKVDE